MKNYLHQILAKYRMGLAGKNERQDVWDSPISRQMLEARWHESDPDFQSGQLPGFKQALRRGRRKEGIRRLSIAAVLVLPLLLTVSWIGLRRASVEMIEVGTSMAEQSSFTLPDGSLIWLNDGSKLRYPEKFKGEQREVWLEGAAFFDVAHNAEQPFVVHTAHESIKVLGTRFEVNAYADDHKSVVSLQSGSVELSNAHQKMLLTPGQEVSIDRNAGSMQSRMVSTAHISSWIFGEVRFEEATLGDIAKVLSRRFDIPIAVVDELQHNERFTLRLRDESLEETLELLSLTLPCKYNISPQQVTIY